MTHKITIAIDGYSSTGKSTIAKQLAQQLGYIYVDSGAMYRAMTLFTMNRNYIDTNRFDVDSLINNLGEAHLQFEYNSNLGYSEMILNDVNVEKEIRTLEVSNLVSKVSAISEVRRKLVTIQKEIGKSKGVVMDGRDIGTVVFPDAELKLFMTASPDKRATRRYKELIARGDDVNYEEILHNVVERDRIDSTREDSPLKKAADTIEFDNSEMGLEEQFKKIFSLVESRL